ncbi:L,D-transpeptidase catalytic domain protein [Leptospira congkakensis]|uniref:L,D-transpeptidase catalytic domain protein n=1 Tax=Leptospira congkakensis TaxID=2484932 RepID=A0A4Z1AD46_9LEPT|nr:L,D-transpeptidase family protein [Leptospira congkakensis]TGL90530.1 L,D-transpeptidase catalytic domain protein [Leptospira congkakensis]TGL91537.1 L,D-transpeptidase catalytic domain protein [Leptospira congkakensis]TGL98590.1 L,D-transpeptidase catalytic domain protein [Leptospira congkakensis]
MSQSFTSIDSPKSLTTFLHFLGFSLKTKQFQCHKIKFTAVLFIFLSFFCFWPLASEGNPLKESPIQNPEQILFVTARAGETIGSLDFYTLSDGEWISVIEKIPVRLGRNGLIQGFEKREGDGHTPSGIFPIKRILGKSKKEIRNLEYTEVRKNYHWNDNPKSKNYNQLTKHKEKGAISLWDSYIYELFFVIEHNTNPAIPGLGSMIFLHVWNEDKPTSGCVGVSKEVLETLVSVLDGNKKPNILIQILD